MTTTRTASQQITDEVTSWPGVEAGPGRRGEFAFKVGRRELGHLHGDHAAHFSFPKAVWAELFEQGRIVHHPVFPGKEGPAARRIDGEADVRDVIDLMRLNYDRAQGRLAAPIPGLHASAPEALSFEPSLHIRAFLLRRDRGNLLIYSSPNVTAQPVSRVYVNHWHEAGLGNDALGAPLFVHAADRDKVAEKRKVRAAFSARHMLDDDFEVIPTPGHTPGATAYLWDNGSHRFLFTGDTIYLRDGEWVAAVLGSSDRDAYIESLDLIRELDFDVLVPWAATADRPYHAVTSNGEARRRIDAIIERVRRGEDH
jgi:hypothetical protein